LDEQRLFGRTAGALQLDHACVVDALWSDQESLVTLSDHTAQDLREPPLGQLGRSASAVGVVGESFLLFLGHVSESIPNEPSPQATPTPPRPRSVRRVPPLTHRGPKGGAP